MGGGKKTTQTQQVFDPGALSGIIQGLQDFSIGKFDGVQAGAAPSSIQALQQGLTPQERASVESQLQAVQEAGTGAEQRISQTVRERAEATGLGASRGAIAQEAAGLANIPLVQAQQRADILGRAGQLERQGLLAGAQLGLQARGQDIQAQQLATQDELRRRQLQLQALLGAGGLAGQVLGSTTRSSGGGLAGGLAGQVLGSTTRSSGGGLAGLIGGIGGALVGGPAGAAAGAQIGGGL